MDLDRLKKTIDWMTSQPVNELELSDGEWSVHLVKSENGVQASTTPVPPEPIKHTPSQSETEDGQLISTPLYGVLHLSPEPASPAYVSVGDGVKAGQTLCLIESMKVFNTITADCDAMIAEFLAADGEEVSAGQPLIRLESVKP